MWMKTHNAYLNINQYHAVSKKYVTNIGYAIVLSSPYGDIAITERLDKAVCERVLEAIFSNMQNGQAVISIEDIINCL